MNPLLESHRQNACQSCPDGNTPAQLVAERLVGIDILRGLAVLVVVMCHVPHYAIGGFRENPWFFPALLIDYGYLGVPLFVLISGFCIHRRASIRQMSSGEWSLDWVAFWKRRFWRLYPPYVAAMLLSVGCAVFLHDRTPNLLSSIWPDTATHLLMVHNLTEDYSGGMGNGAFWSLGMEEQLYLFYFCLFFLISQRSHQVAVLVAAMTTVTWRCVSTWTHADSATLMPESVGQLGSWALWPFSFWLHWALGAVAVDAYFGNCRLPRWCSSLSVALVVGVAGILSNRLTIGFLAKTGLANTFDFPEWSGYVPLVSSVGELAFAVAFFCVLNWCVRAREHFLLRNPLAIGISYVGKVSYSVYLVHIPTIFVLQKQLPFGHSTADWIQRMLIYVSVSLLFGTVFYWLVERWFLAGRCPQLRRSGRPAQSSTATISASLTSHD